MGCAASSAAEVVDPDKLSSKEQENGLNKRDDSSAFKNDLDNSNKDSNDVKNTFSRNIIKSVESDPNILNESPAWPHKIHVQKYKDEDGISNLSLTSKLAAHEYEFQTRTENGETRQEIAHMHVDETQAKLENALKELGQSLYESNNKMYAVDSPNNTQTGLWTGKTSTFKLAI